MRKGTFYQKGITRLGNGAQFVFRIEDAAKEVQLAFFAGEKEVERITVPKEYRNGWLYSIVLDELPKGADGYCYYADGVSVEDFYAGAVSGWKEYGAEKGALRYLLPQRTYDWEEDAFPAHSYEDSVIYGMHVRGFTKHASSGVKKKGTFAGIREKIPYLTDLGITAVELMPVYEFDEIEKTPETYQSRQVETKINYWGFKEGCYYAPKSSYAYSMDAVSEMKDMVKALHRADIEVILQFYFPKSVNYSEIPEILHFWVNEYHIDGFRLLGENLPLSLIGADPFLKDTKLIMDHAGYEPSAKKSRKKQQKNTALWRYDFTYDIRKMLKGDEGCLSSLLFHLQDNPEEIGAVHAVAGYNGFTLQDLVSYDRKHNEANGEDNQDGSDYNCSWNCGVEGKTRKRTVQMLRRRQMKNALAFVMLSQGTPYLQSGDEFGRTQGGNNNPYCQDNEITWVDWRLQKINRDFYDYTKQLVAFRKAHTVFCRQQHLKGLDHLGYGCPDISFHGKEAWKPELESYSRHIGVLYCGKYASDRSGVEDSDFYMAVNMHWEPHAFALPKLSKEKKWEICMDTAMSESFVQLELTESGTVTAAERSIVLCRSVKCDLRTPEKKTEKIAEKVIEK